MNKILLLLAVTFSCSLNLYAQKKIKLTNIKDHRIRLLSEGMRVSYFVRASYASNHGIIKRIDTSSVVIDDKTIGYGDLLRIGRRRSGSGFFQVLCGALGGGIIGSALAPDNTPQCQGCQTQTSVDSGAITAGVIGGVVLIAIGVNSGIRNSPKDIINKWKLEVID